MFDKKLVHVVVGGKHPDCGSAELSVNLVLTRGHGLPTPGPMILPELSPLGSRASDGRKLVEVERKSPESGYMNRSESGYCDAPRCG
jgi:hypothetical protein